MSSLQQKKYRVVDYTALEGIACPCGTARRGFYDEPGFPGTLHRTDIDRTARPHYHKVMIEVYYIISCEPDSTMCLDGDVVPLHDEMALYIPPGTVHCLKGKAKVLIVALPKFDPNDEFEAEETTWPQSSSFAFPKK
jgi:Mannose-6-phosphate isomerase